MLESRAFPPVVPRTRPVALAVRVYRSGGAQSIADATTTAVIFDAVRYDLGTYWTSGAATRLTAALDGYFAIGAWFDYATNGTGVRVLQIRLNGTTTIAEDVRSAVTGTDTMQTVDTNYYLTRGDYVEMLAFQTSGGPLNLIPEAWAHLIR